MNSIFQAFYKHNPNFIKHMTATSFIQILLVSFQVASAFVMVGIIGMVADREQREQIWLFAVACFLGIVSACLDGIYRQWKANRKEDYLAKTREENLDALLHGEYTKVSRYEPGDLLERMQESSVKFTELFVDNLASFSFQLVRLVIVGGILLWLHPFLTVLLLAVYPLVVFFQNKLAGMLGSWQEAMIQKGAEENSFAQAILWQREAILVYGMEAEMERRYAQATKASRQSFLGFLKVYAAQMPFGAFFSVFPQIMLYGGAGFLALHNCMQIEEFLVYSLLAEPILQILYNLFQNLQSLKQQQVHAKRILELWELPKETFGSGQFELDSEIIVEFSHVWFRYQEGMDYVLRDVSFQIKKGEKVYLLGESGQGKSTICRLLMGYYHAERGEIRIGGKQIEEWEINALRRYIMNVTQQVYLLPDTVRQNVRFFVPEADLDREEEWKEAIHTLRMEPLWKDDRSISQNGLQLSGGEKKRLALLRAFLIDTPLLLLDEPYAGLDPTTMQAVETLLLQKSSTILVISHEASETKDTIKKLRLQNGGISVEA